MNNSQIRCFLSAAKHLSFTRAAEEMYLSQPGLSRQIAALENELGVSLFERRRNSIRLTAAGELCEKYFSRWKNDFLQMTADLENLNRNQRIPLVIGGLEGQLIGKCYENVLSWFWVNRPNVELRLSYYPASHLAGALVSGDIDLAFLPEREVENNPEIAYKRTRRDRCCLVVPADHPMANKENPSLFDFQDEVFLMLEDGDSEAVSLQHKMVARMDSFKPRAIRAVPTFGTLSMLLESKSGVSVLNKWHSLRSAPYLKFIEVPEIGYRVEAVAWRKGDDNPVVREFVDRLESSEEMKN